MSETLTATMIHSISDVLETMFFLPAEPGEPADLGQSGLLENTNLTAALIEFEGSVSGKLIVVAPDSLLAEMTENFIGEPQEKLTLDLVQGTLKEFLNMVCGNGLRQWESKAVFELSIPEMINISDLDVDKSFVFIQVMETRMAVLVDQLQS